VARRCRVSRTLRKLAPLLPMHLIPRSYIALPGHERIIGVDVHEYVGISVVDGYVDMYMKSSDLMLSLGWDKGCYGMEDGV